MPIQLLDQHTAELIAAGEVVERPASVVKELCENAIDAGASSVKVEIERGGVGLIRIEDNGGGIPKEELPLAFLRHATSKVRTADDLDAIGTLGFRGEALASIASVARVELVSCTPEAAHASGYRIEGGSEVGLYEAARGRGTTISVRDLFYNTPARMKFLKKDASEGGFVGEVMNRLALSRPDIAFTFVRDGKQVFSTPGDGQARSAAYTVLGGAFARELLAVDERQGPYSVTGLVTPPRAARASRSMQSFFINERYVKNRTMMAALEQAYRGTTMQGRFPGCVLFLEMPPQLVDVNVHPAKTEVRFAAEKDVFSAVYRAVKGALAASMQNAGSFQLSGAQDVPKDAARQPETREAREQTGSAAADAKPMTAPAEPKPAGKVASPGDFRERPGARQVGAYNDMVATLASEPGVFPYSAGVPSERGLDILVDEDDPVVSLTRAPSEGPAGAVDHDDAPPPAKEEPAQPEEAAPHPPEQTAFVEQTEPLRLVGEIFDTYILAQQGQTLCVIDKHAAHERILYEQLVAAKQRAGAQQLLAPVTVAMGAAEKAAVLENEELLRDAGFELDDFGGGDVLVRAVPADIEPRSVEDLVLELAGRMVRNPGDTSDSHREWILHSIACRAAVKAGDKSRPEELLELAQSIMEGRVPPFCPHGRPVVLKITRKELEKQFGRLG